MRNTIQKAKTDMANEVIDAGRFDMQTTMEERKITLESLLQVSLPQLARLPECLVYWLLKGLAGVRAATTLQKSQQAGLGWEISI